MAAGTCTPFNVALANTNETDVCNPSVKTLIKSIMVANASAASVACTLKITDGSNNALAVVLPAFSVPAGAVWSSGPKEDVLIAANGKLRVIGAANVYVHAWGVEVS